MLAITIYLGFCMPTMCARKKHVFKLESTRVISILHPPVSRGRGKKGGSVGGRMGEGRETSEGGVTKQVWSRRRGIVPGTSIGGEVAIGRPPTNGRR